MLVAFQQRCQSSSVKKNRSIFPSIWTPHTSRLILNLQTKNKLKMNNKFTCKYKTMAKKGNKRKDERKSWNDIGM